MVAALVAVASATTTPIAKIQFRTRFINAPPLILNEWLIF
jgi:hypothetical protein